MHSIPNILLLVEAVAMSPLVFPRTITYLTRVKGWSERRSQGGERWRVDDGEKRDGDWTEKTAVARVSLSPRSTAYRET